MSPLYFFLVSAPSLQVPLAIETYQVLRIGIYYPILEVYGSYPASVAVFAIRGQSGAAEQVAVASSLAFDGIRVGGSSPLVR